MADERLEAELQWWRDWLTPATLPRLLAIYGMRYLTFWFMEFQDMGRVCDIGSGPISAAWISASFDELICIDPNARDYRPIAGNILGRRLALDQAILFDASDLEDASFDTVLCLNTLDHVEDQTAVLEACHRLVRPSGKVLLWVHLREQDPGDGLHTALTENGVIEMAQAAGLRVEASMVGYCETQRGGQVVSDLALWGSFRRQ